MFNIDYNSYKTTKGFSKRVRFLVLHYTALDFAASAQALTKNFVSAHYLVPDPKDRSYMQAGFEGVRVFSLVDEHDRAWHAGVSRWENRTNLNDSSIGIELVNLARVENGKFVFPPFDDQQIEVLISLIKNILQRYPDIKPHRVVGHSDIAPGRKSDPGAAFPWKRLYDAGIGAWYDDGAKRAMLRSLKISSRCRIDAPLRRETLQLLNTFGYDTTSGNSDSGFRDLIRAFQLHFRPENHNGQLDIETVIILKALVDKYFPSSSRSQSVEV